MKKIFLFLFLIVSFLSVFSQATYTKVNGKWEYVFLKIDSGCRIPRDTLASADSGSIAVKGATLYIKLPPWTAISGSGGNGVWGFITGTFTSQTDLHNALGAKYDTSKAKMDTLYAITDSTYGEYINGRFTSFKARGRLLSFNGRGGSIVLTQADVDTALGYVASNLPNVLNLLQVINAGGAASLATGLYSARGAAGTLGRFYVATDSLKLYFDNGTLWLTIGGGGSSGVPVIPSNTVKGYLNAYASFVGFNTDSIPQGSTNKYFVNPMTTTNDLIVQSGGTYSRLAGPSHDGMKLSRVGGVLAWTDTSAGGGSGSPNSNVGSGYRWAVSSTNNIKTIFCIGCTIDSTTNTNALTITVVQPIGANPSQQIDGSVHNGIAGTWMRSDAVPGIANNTITNALSAQMAPGTVKSNLGAGTSNAADNTLAAIAAALPPANYAAGRGLSATILGGLPALVLGMIPGQVMDSIIYITLGAGFDFTIDSIANHFKMKRVNVSINLANILGRDNDSSLRSVSAAQLITFLALTPSNVGLSNVVNSLQVINAGASTSFKTGLYSARPSATTCNCYYVATDSLKIYYDNGSWLTIAGGGSGGGSAALLTYQPITSGTSATGTAPNLIVNFNFSSAVAAYTFTMPSSPTDQQVVEFEGYGTQTTGTQITSLTIIGTVSGTPLTTFDVGEDAKFKWNNALSVWIRQY